MLLDVHADPRASAPAPPRRAHRCARRSRRRRDGRAGVACRAALRSCRHRRSTRSRSRVDRQARRAAARRSTAAPVRNRRRSSGLDVGAPAARAPAPTAAPRDADRRRRWSPTRRGTRGGRAAGTRPSRRAPAWALAATVPPEPRPHFVRCAIVSFAPGPPLTDTAVRIVLLGSGELGREVAIEAMRLGCEVMAVDRYANAPAMQVAQRHAVVDMTDPAALKAVLEAERARPCAQLLVVPELEAIATARAPRARTRRAARRADGARRAVDDGPRGHPAARRRGARPEDLRLPLLRHRGRGRATRSPRSARRA